MSVWEHCLLNTINCHQAAACALAVLHGHTKPSLPSLPAQPLETDDHQRHSQWQDTVSTVWNSQHVYCTSDEAKVYMHGIYDFSKINNNSTPALTKVCPSPSWCLSANKMMYVVKSVSAPVTQIPATTVLSQLHAPHEPHVREPVPPGAGTRLL